MAKAKTAAQQVEIDMLRARKQKSQEAAASPEVLHDAQQGQAFFSRLMDSMREMGLFVPGWKRTLIALISSFALGYVIGSVAAVLIDILIVSALLVTGSTFIAVCIYVLGFIVALYTAFKAGQKLGMYIVTGDIDRDIATAWNWTKGLFATKPMVRA